MLAVCYHRSATTMGLHRMAYHAGLTVGFLAKGVLMYLYAFLALAGCFAGVIGVLSGVFELDSVVIAGSTFVVALIGAVISDQLGD